MSLELVKSLGTIISIVGAKVLRRRRRLKERNDFWREFS